MSDVNPSTDPENTTRSAGRRVPAVTAGVAAVLVAGAVAGGPLAAAAAPSHSFHAEFASAFTPGVVVDPADDDGDGSGGSTVKL